MSTFRLTGFAIEDLGDGAWVAAKAPFVDDPEGLFRVLQTSLPLRAESISMWGREVPMPRLTSFHGDPGLPYRYSGRTFEPAPFSPELDVLRGALQAATGHRFTSAVANLYRDGRDAIGWHADDEPELGPEPDNVLIASISLGAPRRFLLRKIGDPSQGREYHLGGGSLLLMGGTTQRGWQHSVPRTAKAVGPRLNLTFRIVRRVSR